ncbi:MAG TPA: DUF3536 domain-containing protein, partial [Anaerolineales bacterium]|nr:DUF3536 domain-containing protein [Anaerolineales bacterium]
VSDFLAAHGLAGADQDVVDRLGLLLAASYFRQRMYTASTFKYEDLARPEPRYAIANGLQAIRLTQKATGADLLSAFRRDLAQAASNRTGQTGAHMLDAIQSQAASSE